MTALHGTDTEATKDITVFNDYYYQEYSDNPPYIVGYFDYKDHDNSDITTGYYYSQEEANAAAADLIALAEQYDNSLLKGAYTFTDFLGFHGIREVTE